MSTYTSITVLWCAITLIILMYSDAYEEWGEIKKIDAILCLINALLWSLIHIFQ